jgi:GT2 family glycosyltransferase
LEGGVRNGTGPSLETFGREVLGPLVAAYLGRLLSTCLYFDKSRNAKILFAARAGVRIRHALGVYSERAGFSLPDDWEHFWISRLMVAKGVYDAAPDETVSVFRAEYSHTPWALAQECLIGNEPVEAQSASHFYVRRNNVSIDQLLAAKDSRTAALRQHLSQQSGLFRTETTRVLGGRDTALIVDTGWAATTQRMLMTAWPDVEWWGAYFGLSAPGLESRKHWNRAIALVFQADKVDIAHPESSIIEHRHVIESLFEPLAPSIERYEETSSGKVSIPGARENLASLERDHDPMFAGVLEHLRTSPVDPLALEAAATDASRQLSDILLTPTRAWAELFGSVRRSADFGRRFSVPVILDESHAASASDRISRSLWKAGQIAVEYEPGMAASIQRKRFGLTVGPLMVSRPSLPKPAPLVTVVTRTMDRPMFLRRALLSVHRQTWRNFRHVVVCDGGDIAAIREAVVQANIDHSKIVLVDAVRNRGMEAASNLGIRASPSEYAVIHDDDDTWAPEFLERCVDFLQSARGSKYGGVTTRSTYVSESVAPEGIRIEGHRSYNPGLVNVAISDMSIANMFPPISFVFRRAIYDEIGGFDERFPVLGDWDFNLRFLQIADIGVLPEELAYYHHRDVGETGFFGNSVIDGVDKHIEYSSVLRNAFVRGDGGRSTSGSLVGAGAQIEVLRNNVLQKR